MVRTEGFTSQPDRHTLTDCLIAGVRDALAHAPAFTAQPPVPLQILTGEGDIWDIMSDPRAYCYCTAHAAIYAVWRPSGGIIGISDGVALGVMESASERGLKAGLDFAILGFDDDPEARAMGLTSLRPPCRGWPVRLPAC